jgi:hypothetical protein
LTTATFTGSKLEHGATGRHVTRHPHPTQATRT